MSPSAAGHSSGCGPVAGAGSKCPTGSGGGAGRIGAPALRQARAGQQYRAGACGCDTVPFSPTLPEGRFRARTLLVRVVCAPRKRSIAQPPALPGCRRWQTITNPTAVSARLVAHDQGQSVHPARLRAVAGTAAISWRRCSDRSVTFSAPGGSCSSVASCADVMGRGWRAAITSSVACWRAVS
jgi:hypothetical protein